MHPLADHGLLAWLPSAPDMMILALLVLVLFGAKKLPLFARSLGRSMGEFRRAREEYDRHLREAGDDEDALSKDPHAATNRFFGIIFFFCLLMLIVSIVRQVISH